MWLPQILEIMKLTPVKLCRNEVYYRILDSSHIVWEGQRVMLGCSAAWSRPHSGMPPGTISLPPPSLETGTRLLVCLKITFRIIIYFDFEKNKILILYSARSKSSCRCVWLETSRSHGFPLASRKSGKHGDATHVGQSPQIQKRWQKPTKEKSQMEALAPLAWECRVPRCQWIHWLVSIIHWLQA